MTLDHFAATYRVPLGELLPRLGLPLPIDVAAVLAGSLAALDIQRWEWAGLVDVLASFAGGILPTPSAQPSATSS